jgi:hypothetical protein
MLSALSLAAALLANGAQAASSAPAEAGSSAKGAAGQTTSTATASAPHTPDSCPPPSADSRVIVVCTQRPQGYRLNPDVMEAKRETRSAGRPVRPGGKVIPDCTHVGPAPCVTAGINLIGAALTAAQMAERLGKGQEIGSMFVTDPHPSEYQLYKMAKARREAQEAEKAAAKAKAKMTPAPEDAGVPQPAGN